MTILTYGLFVLAQQLEFGVLVMVKRRFIPLFVRVALITLVRKSTIMTIIHLVATNALLLDFNLVWVFFMAIDALQFFVPSLERKFSLLIMVKTQILPTMCIMALLALLAFVPSVYIVVFVTGITIGWRFLILVLWVAVDAFHRFMLAVKPEFCLVVIKQNLIPAN